MAAFGVKALSKGSERSSGAVHGPPGARETAWITVPAEPADQATVADPLALTARVGSVTELTPVPLSWTAAAHSPPSGWTLDSMVFGAKAPSAQTAVA